MRRGAWALWAPVWGLALLGMTAQLGSLPLIDPDEGRNAEVAREMAASGDYVAPRLNGLPYLDKPIVFFAATALSIEVLGPTELAARLPSVLFTVATVLLTIWFGRRVLGSGTGMLAGLALATCPLVLAFARTVIFDAAMMWWITLALVAIYLTGGDHAVRWSVVAWAAIGLGALTKGPVALAVPLLVLGAYRLLCRSARTRLFTPLGLATFALIVVPWVGVMVSRFPEFPHYAFVYETFERVATDRLRRVQPWYFFLLLLPAAALPWTLLPVMGVAHLRERWRQRAADGRAVTFLLCWVAVPLAFFTLSRSKTAGYILPVYPAVALLASEVFHSDLRATRRAGWTYAALAIGLAASLAFGLRRLVAGVRMAPAVAATLPRTGALAGTLFGVSAALAAVGVATNRSGVLAAGLAVAAPALPIAGAGLLRAMYADRSSEEIARAVRTSGAPGARVVGAGTYPPSLAFYLQQPLLLATASAGELTSNYLASYQDKYRDTSASPLRPPGWWREAVARCRNDLFVLAGAGQQALRDSLAVVLPLVVSTRRHALYGPCRREVEP